ncbi:CitMHS family transporter [Caulobacter segnis]|uniref:Citrate/H+ symporter, CitMHS family n=1 Tax=Caulobacter segnis (strain ATCC 21756 / DSM 7131 / JCM 7823 / NBRC 15250 / LMG 17158 / TK0059) TaxID=509190 RepID=D5VLQ8_CAUST|nr:citrate:proton symporter [Caulobacter segnis]ADG11431.1 citrate/H+ symporter, CitMHS family [Caulobacter segnis ATCC 21756]
MIDVLRQPAVLGLLMIVSFMTLIMTRRLSAITALILTPVVFGLLAGAGAGVGEMMVKGVTDLTPTALMLAFAVLYFGLMIDVGLFDPLVRLVLRTVGDDPVRVTVGTALLATIVSLDGDGATTALVTISAMLPIYRRLGLNPLILALMLGICASVTNLLPWGGPTARAASALGIDQSLLFLPMMPTMLAGLGFGVLVAYGLGLAERKRLGRLALRPLPLAETQADSPADPGEDLSARRPRLFVFNLALTIVLMVGLLSGLAPLPVLMMCAFAIALIVNYPALKLQRERIAAHADNVVNIVLLIFAAGAFTGILSGTGMVSAMASSLVAAIPPELGPYLAPITALIGMPLTFFMSNDAYYFGILPVIAETASHYGIPPEAIARAALTSLPIHALSPLIAAIYLVCGLLEVDVGALQRFALKWAVASSLVMIAAALASGAFLFRVG